MVCDNLVVSVLFLHRFNIDRMPSFVHPYHAVPQGFNNAGAAADSNK